MTNTTSKSQLPKCTTADLIAQYELAISRHTGRYTNAGLRQKRINYIVDLLLQRAENGDSEAEEFFN